MPSSLAIVSRLANPARGEIVAMLGGGAVRLCVTLRALAELEGHFRVSGLDALAERLKSLDAADLGVVLQALVVDDVDLGGRDIALAEAIDAVVGAFGAMHA